MIDTVLDLGFERRGVYTGYIFIPRYGDNQSSKVNKRSMNFKRSPLRRWDYDMDHPTYMQSADVPEITDEPADYLLRIETPGSLESQ